MHGMVAPCWNFPDGFCADWTLEEPLVASNKGDPKPHDPLITTVACKHVWGGLIPPLQHDCVFGCKFLPAVKSEKTLISSVCPPVPPAGNDRFTRGSSTYQFPSPPQLEHMEYIVVWGKYILRISPAPLQERSRVDYSRCHKTAHWKRVKWPATVNGTQKTQQTCASGSKGFAVVWVWVRQTTEAPKYWKKKGDFPTGGTTRKYPRSAWKNPLLQSVSSRTVISSFHNVLFILCCIRNKHETPRLLLCSKQGHLGDALVNANYRRSWILRESSLRSIFLEFSSNLGIINDNIFNQKQ